MGTPSDETRPGAAPPGAPGGAPQEAPIPEMRPWREVGWIFRDGDTVAIERQGERTRTRSVRVSHLREE